MKLAHIRPQVGSILVVDDEPDILDSLKDLLEAHLPGVRVLTALNGTKGLDLMQREAVDLVVADYRMPGMDGLEFLTRCRKQAPRVPRILITAFPELDAAMRAINEAAIQNFLTKPLQPETLMSAINAALVKARAGLPAQ